MKVKSLLKTCTALSVLMLVSQYASYAQNILDLSGWAVGTGGTNGFTLNGLVTENSREWGEGPQGRRVVLWKAEPSGDGINDGGFNSLSVPIVHTNMYRYSLWIKKTNSNSGSTYLGTISANGGILNLDGTINNNAYFWSGDLPQLNKWYLLVGYVHGSGDVSTTSYGALYDGGTGAKLSTGFTDFKFAAGAANALLRGYLFYDAHVGDLQYFYAPRIDLINGNEPTIAALLGLESQSSDQAYFSGNVGIGIANPTQKLAVNGNIRAKEIKVEMSGWPDYVFSKNYKLPSLKETETHIKENGHLPGMPSAKEVESEGVNLGEMNKKLLEKVEEMTLYVIEMKHEIEALKHPSKHPSGH